MEWTDSLKTVFIETSQVLKGSARRLFMARTVKELGPSGQRQAERDLGWNRITLRKGTHALDRASSVLMPFALGDAGGLKTTCRISWVTSEPSSMARVKLLPGCVPSSCPRV